MTLYPAADRFEIVHVLNESYLVDSGAIRRRYRALQPEPLVAGWYLAIWPQSSRSRRYDTHTEYIGPFETPSAAGAAIGAIDPQFACHA